MTLTRGLTKDFEGISPTMQTIAETVPVAPAIYNNFAAPPVALGQYLGSHEKPESWVGMYTLAPVFRLLSKFGFAAQIPDYEENYSTPAEVNTSTYLKNLHSDFGWLGIIWGPFIIGAAAAGLHRRLHKPVFLVAMPFLCTVVAFSFVALTISGDWYIGLIASVFGMIWVQRPVKATTPWRDDLLTLLTAIRYPRG